MEAGTVITSATTGEKMYPELRKRLTLNQVIQDYEAELTIDGDSDAAMERVERKYKIMRRKEWRNLYLKYLGFILGTALVCGIVLWTGI